jgi:hypothetical protein
MLARLRWQPTRWPDFAIVNPASSQDVRPQEIGKFGIGLWHQKPGTPPLDWVSVMPGTALGPFDWTIEPYEIAIMCFCAELHAPAYLARRSAPLPLVAPVGAIWASFSLIQGHFVVGRIVDVSHEVRWHQPMHAGEPVTIAGQIAEKYERRGRHYLAWNTRCARAGGAAVFDVRHTIIDLAMQGVT